MTDTVEILFRNIDEARRLSSANESAGLVALVSGSREDRENWQYRFDKTSSGLFNADGSTVILSLQEKIGNKTREGNFLGTLLAYKKIKEFAGTHHFSYRERVTLVGMIFGRGERMSPFTQIEGNRKPAIKVNSYGYQGESLTAIEEALMYFVPVVHYLETRGFRGVLDKWGDETEIPSVDLSSPEPSLEMEDWDVIKFVSVLKIEGDLARQKDWVVFDDMGRMKAQLSRGEPEVLVARLKEMGISPREGGAYYGGVSLGPVAVSYDVLDIAEELFEEEILKEGIFFDFDPYFLMALSMDNDVRLWQKMVDQDKGLQELQKMIPCFFEKVQTIKTRFAREKGRSLNLKVFDLGPEVYWADIGQHSAMGEKFMSLLSGGPEGLIARHLENLTQLPDERGNIILNSTIEAGVEVSGSVVINSTIDGKGRISSCVIKDSVLHDPEMQNSFVVLSRRPAEATILKGDCGLYHSLGKTPLVLEPGFRHGTLLLEDGPVDLVAEVETNLRDRENTYNVPVLENPISFREAFEKMADVSMAELERRRRALKV